MLTRGPTMFPEFFVASCLYILVGERSLVLGPGRGKGSRLINMCLPFQKFTADFTEADSHSYDYGLVHLTE